MTWGTLLAASSAAVVISQGSGATPRLRSRHLHQDILPALRTTQHVDLNLISPDWVGKDSVEQSRTFDCSRRHRKKSCFASTNSLCSTVTASTSSCRTLESGCGRVDLTVPQNRPGDKRHLSKQKRREASFHSLSSSSMWQSGRYHDNMRPRQPTVLPTTRSTNVIKLASLEMGDFTGLSTNRGQLQKSKTRGTPSFEQDYQRSRYLDEETSSGGAMDDIFKIKKDRATGHHWKFSTDARNGVSHQALGMTFSSSPETETWSPWGDQEVEWGAGLPGDELHEFSCPSFDEGAPEKGQVESLKHTARRSLEPNVPNQLSIIGSATRFNPSDDWSPEVFTPSSTVSKRSWSLPDWEDTHSIGTFNTADDMSARKENFYPTQERFPVPRSQKPTGPIPVKRHAIPDVRQRTRPTPLQSRNDFNSNQVLPEEEQASASNNRSYLRTIAEAGGHKTKRRWTPFGRLSARSSSASTTTSSDKSRTSKIYPKPPRYQVLDEYRDYQPRLNLAPALNRLFRCGSKRHSFGQNYLTSSRLLPSSPPKEVNFERTPATSRGVQRASAGLDPTSPSQGISTLDGDVSSEITQSPAFSDPKPSPRSIPSKLFPPPPASPALVNSKRKLYLPRVNKGEDQLSTLSRPRFEPGWWKNLPKRKLEMDGYLEPPARSDSISFALQDRDWTEQNQSTDALKGAGAASGPQQLFLQQLQQKLEHKPEDAGRSRGNSSTRSEATASSEATSSSLSSNSYYTDSFYSGSSHDDLELDMSDLCWSTSQDNGSDWMMVVVTGWSVSDRVETYHLHQRIVAKLATGKTRNATKSVAAPRTSRYFENEITGSKETGAGSYSIVEVDDRAASLIPMVLDYLYGNDQKERNRNTRVKDETSGQLSEEAQVETCGLLLIERDNAVPLLFLSKYFGIEGLQRKLEDFLEDDLNKNHSEGTKTGRTVAQQYFREAKDYDQDALLRQILGVKSFSASSSISSEIATKSMLATGTKEELASGIALNRADNPEK